ncbi:hypothetical protein MA16_Dca008087 [Dendrobium catenatum]|uniref:Uncharacterized protein n=1 Tax=Dendrobium catenatum TaxID=906689 RepID=A0A2I0WCZ9_9ASPA|nr:hypothetical protein MA16_Dca008087 [Dendrobium catenatum]
MEEGAAFTADHRIPPSGLSLKFVHPDGSLRIHKSGILQIREPNFEVLKKSSVVIGKGKGIISQSPVKIFKSPSFQKKNAVDNEASSLLGLKLFVNKFNNPTGMEGTFKADFKLVDDAIEDYRELSGDNVIQRNQNAHLPTEGRNMFKVLSCLSSVEQGIDGVIVKDEDLEEGEINCTNSDLTVSKTERMDELVKSKGKLLKELSSLGKDNILLQKKDG